MQEAVFSILNYKFDKVVIDLDYYKNHKLSVDFDTNGIFSEKEHLFELIFTVKVFNEGVSEAFVSIRCKGVFKFENQIAFNEIPQYFFSNSIAILFPYVRAYLSLVTTQANMQGIILPTLNLSGLEDTLRKNITLK